MPKSLLEGFWVVFFSLHGKAWCKVVPLVVDEAELGGKRCSCFLTLQRSLAFGFQTAVKPEKPFTQSRVWAQSWWAAAAAEAPRPSCPSPPALPCSPWVQIWLQPSPSLPSALLFSGTNQRAEAEQKLCTLTRTLSASFPLPRVEDAGCWSSSLSRSRAGLCVGPSLPHHQQRLGSSHQLPDTSHDGRGLGQELLTPPWRSDRYLLENPLKGVKAWQRHVFTMPWGWHWVGKLA